MKLKLTYFNKNKNKDETLRLPFADPLITMLQRYEKDKCDFKSSKEYPANNLSVKLQAEINIHKHDFKHELNKSTDSKLADMMYNYSKVFDTLIKVSTIVSTTDNIFIQND